MPEVPPIDGTPSEENPRNFESLPDEPDISIPLDAPDAIERLEALQDEVAIAHTGRPMPENNESHDVTQEDEDDLDATLLTHDVHQTIREQGRFDQDPSHWLEGTVLKHDVLDLLALRHAGYDEGEIERMTEKMAEDYPAKFKDMNGGVMHSSNPHVKKINLTKEEYRDTLHQAYLSKMLTENPAPSPLPKMVQIDKSEEQKSIERGESIDKSED